MRRARQPWSEPCGISSKIGSTVIFVTHKTNMLTLADKVLLMEQGTVRLYGERDEVVAKIFGGPKVVPFASATACKRSHRCRPLGKTR